MVMVGGSDLSKETKPRRHGLFRGRGECVRIRYYEGGGWGEINARNKEKSRLGTRQGRSKTQQQWNNEQCSLHRKKYLSFYFLSLIPPDFNPPLHHVSLPTQYSGLNPAYAFPLLLGSLVARSQLASGMSMMESGFLTLMSLSA